MGQDRRNYRYGRVYIEAARILNPQFNGVTLTLTGAQVELLRNATMLFHLQDAFVDTYHDGYFMNASDADYNNIQAIVADLEEKLMGNINILWGYSEHLASTRTEDDAEAGINYLTFASCPAGEIWIIETIDGYNINTNPTAIQFESLDASVIARIQHELSPGTNIPVVWNGKVTLAQGCHIRVRFDGCALNDNLRAHVWGYKMVVPT